MTAAIRATVAGSVLAYGLLLLLALTASVSVAARASTPSAPVAAVTATQLVALATVPVGADPTGVAVDAAAHAVYVTNQGDDTVSVIDGTALRVVATIKVGRSPAAVAVDAKLRRVFVANQDDRSVSVIDATTNQVVDTIATGARPSDLAVDPATDRVYVADGDDVRSGNPSGTVRAVDGRTGRVVATAAVGGLGSVVDGLAVDPSANAVFVPYALRSNPPVLLMLDGATLRTLAGNAVSNGTYRGTALGSFGVAVDPATHRVLATSPIGFPVVVFDGASAASFRQTPGTIRVGASPVSVAVDPSTRTVYVTESGQFWGDAPNRDAVTAVDEATGRVIATVGVGIQPWGVGVDPGTHLVYVANHLGRSVTVIAGVDRPSAGTPSAR